MGKALLLKQSCLIDAEGCAAEGNGLVFRRKKIAKKP